MRPNPSENGGYLEHILDGRTMQPDPKDWNVYVLPENMVGTHGEGARLRETSGFLVGFWWVFGGFVVVLRTLAIF